MEESAKDQQPPVASGNEGKKSILRYPLRSASKLKDQLAAKSPDAPTNSASAASKRGRPPANLSKSVSALELSRKDKPGKPPRRLSIPTKSTVSPRQKLTSNITPISEARTKRSTNGQEKSETPRSDVSKSSTRRKFSVLASASYWLQQIKLSESAVKHSVSLGFFKLALEAGCEPLQILREELKSYARRHNLGEHGETVKSLFESYEISETLEQLQVSETCSHVPEESTTPSEDGVQSTTSTTAGTRKLKPKSLNSDTQATSARASSKKENVQRTTTAIKTRSSENRNPVNRRLVTENGVNDVKKKGQKTGKQESNNEGGKGKTDEESVVEEVANKQPQIEATLEEGNKENMEVPFVAEISAA